MSKLEVNFEVPNFVTKDYNDKDFDIKEYKGSNVLVVLNRGFS